MGVWRLGDRTDWPRPRELFPLGSGDRQSQRLLGGVEQRGTPLFHEGPQSPGHSPLPPQPCPLQRAQGKDRDIGVTTVQSLIFF